MLKMRLNPKTKIIVLVIILFVFIMSTSLFGNYNLKTKDPFNFKDGGDNLFWDMENLRIGKISDPIYINNNWSAAVAAGICSGNGTYAKPYIIEDIVVDGGGSESCIIISNSYKPFIIRNCTVYNSGGYRPTGIRLYNVNNSKLEYNNCSFNRYGIRLGLSFNNTISENKANNNYVGISLDFFSENNILTENTANQNDQGITVEFSNNNLITRNVVNFNRFDGIYLSDNENNIILKNTAKNNRNAITLVSSDNNFILQNMATQNYVGIELVSCYNNIISGNIMDECGLSIRIDIMDSMCSHVIDTTNLVNGKPLYYYYNEKGLGSANFTNAGQIILINCNNSFISNLDLLNGTFGITMYYCNNNNISGNNVNYNSVGIYLFFCSNNILRGNSLNFNYVGIALENYCKNNLISGNAVKNSDLIGIRLSSSYFNLIFGNHLFNNTNGIQLTHSESNRIYFNNILDDIFATEMNNNMNSSKRMIYIYKNETYVNYLGNYWSDYTGNDTDNDGIGDTPHITSEVIDYYPLMEPIENYNIISEEGSREIIGGYNPFYILGILSFLILIIGKKKKSKKLTI